MTDQPQDSYAGLAVIDELRVGPVRLEKSRLLASYSVTANGREEKKELIYSYGEPVFNPKAPEDQNLASFIAAQLALNYGVFCKRIVLDGAFTAADRRFLRDMLENTSREIYVKKLLQPNPFLQGAAVGVPAEKRQRYTNAELVFANSRGGASEAKETPWATSSDSYCVLSSGGKDSLLSYGLLKELGKEVHPIFGNESGRHWFTAVNGYRYQQSVEPNTAKVWMNSDRLFAWMLRHLPFIRQDFATVRADDYPIRLWTVAVFLVGVLPLMKKRGIGRLLIGNEYDTTRRLHHEGIPHYDGLYDQSRFFDEAFTRYFIAKGWGVEQFSILRPISEFMIQKILTQRYPDLQANQLSCHAAHEEEGRMRPCGRCEKCRRIVGMLSVIGGDPHRCGYTDEQIAYALKSLDPQRIKQLGADAAQLFYLLHQAGLVEAPRAKAHPEVMRLRFDKERSPVDVVPEDIRKALYDIVLPYTEGAVRWEKGKWVDWVDWVD
ncbi:MAG: hypothetical protein H6557_20140 [Lewinellaceae bacterium]|nr:hypothetical protein [Phaeodactylibacter sp.]MCB9038929.1 hypothetical protein [Lewinellaceae bacterium]